MKKLLLLLSVVAVSFALQAGDGDCPMKKAGCDKAKAAGCEKTKVGTCEKGKGEGKGCCPASKKAEEAAKKPISSPKSKA